MANVISVTSIPCGSCAGTRPVVAITMGGGKFEIDAAKYVDCGSCAGQCPVVAISEG